MNLIQDLRSALRQVTAAPGLLSTFAVPAVLGIAISAAAFHALTAVDRTRYSTWENSPRFAVWAEPHVTRESRPMMAPAQPRTLRHHSDFFDTLGAVGGPALLGIATAVASSVSFRRPRQ